MLGRGREKRGREIIRRRRMNVSSHSGRRRSGGRGIRG